MKLNMRTEYFMIQPFSKKNIRDSRFSFRNRIFTNHRQSPGKSIPYSVYQTAVFNFNQRQMGTAYGNGHDCQYRTRQRTDIDKSNEGCSTFSLFVLFETKVFPNCNKLGLTGLLVLW